MHAFLAGSPNMDGNTFAIFSFDSTGDRLSKPACGETRSKRRHLKLFLLCTRLSRSEWRSRHCFHLIRYCEMLRRSQRLLFAHTRELEKKRRHAEQPVCSPLARLKMLDIWQGARHRQRGEGQHKILTLTSVRNS